MPFKEAVPFGDNASAYDGDTIYQGGQGFRLYGIDTEEMKRKGVQADSQPDPSHGAVGAQQYLADIMAREKVSFEEKGVDAYGRRVFVLSAKTVVILTKNWCAMLVPV